MDFKSMIAKLTGQTKKMQEAEAAAKARNAALHQQGQGFTNHRFAVKTHS